MVQERFRGEMVHGTRYADMGRDSLLPGRFERGSVHDTRKVERGGGLQFDPVPMSTNLTDGMTEKLFVAYFTMPFQ
jgi:hypothetical protein